MEVNISIIVPVYKIEKYIDRCIKSILDQRYKEFELILIDDGSPDNSGNICDLYAMKDSRIKVIHKENTGVSDSRNVGLKYAKGKYIMFVDGDDWIESNSLELLADKINNNEVDLIIYGIIKDLYSNNKLIKSEINAIVNEKKMDIKELPTEFEYLINTIKMLPAWMYLFKADIIRMHSLNFNEELVVYEDFEFNLRYISKCKDILIIPQIIYHYIMDVNVNQLSKRNTFNLVSNINFVSNTILNFLEEIDADENMMRYMQTYIFDLYVLCLKKIIIHRKEINYSKKIEVLKDLKNDDIFKMVMEVYGEKFKFYRLLYYFMNKNLYEISYLLLYKLA